MKHIEVLLPIPLKQAFTYVVSDAEHDFLQIGMRVAVPFGKRKITTGLVWSTSAEEPLGYEAKEIFQILDEKSIVSQQQLDFWVWLSNYYMCTLGEVMRAALPAAFLLESETWIQASLDFEEEEQFDSDQQELWDGLKHAKSLRLSDLMELLGKKKALDMVQGMIALGALEAKEKIFDRYLPKWVKYLSLADGLEEADLEKILEDLSRAPKQREALMHFFARSGPKKRLKVSELKAETAVSVSAVDGLIKKGIFQVERIREDRLSFAQIEQGIYKLSAAQEETLQQLKQGFEKQEVGLLHGVTSSGKTEVYLQLAKEQLDRGKQVLFLVPEIALTTQLIERLKVFFGNSLAVYHSKYSVHERIETWNNILDQKEKARLVLGPRSAVFLPFQKLGLIIVDEEHDQSYKQREPNPRYQARDAAMVLGRLHGAKVLLGSATPALESTFNAKSGKYFSVSLEQRFQNTLLPEAELIDLKEAYKKKKMKGHFSERLIEMMEESLREKGQVILFQNRRGYAPFVECDTCGHAPDCPNCDVSLTLHKYRNELKCHYCGYAIPMPSHCPSCAQPTLKEKGFGTEQIEKEVKELFPSMSVGRMDLETTRGKNSYRKIIEAFDLGETRILIGTQMVAKGLDFSKVHLVGVLSADHMLNFPDFRSHERTFQILVQVSGRAGRSGKRGKVAIQSYNPYHRILQQVTLNQYASMYEDQMEERRTFDYPPFNRLIEFTLKDRDAAKVERAAQWLAEVLRSDFGAQVLGPTSPGISRIRNLYLKTILLKIDRAMPLKQVKVRIESRRHSFQAIPQFRSVRLVIDVDPQ